MSIYTATFSGVAVSADQDIFEIVAGPSVHVAIRRIILGQYSEFGDAAAELLPIKIIRGHTTAGSGGSTVVPCQLAQQATKTSTSAVAINNTTPAANGTPEVLWSESWNVMAGFVYPTVFAPMVSGRDSMALIRIGPGQRLVVNLATDPADEITLSGSIEFEETKLP